MSLDAKSPAVTNRHFAMQKSSFYIEESSFPIEESSFEYKIHLRSSTISPSAHLEHKQQPLRGHHRGFEILSYISTLCVIYTLTLYINIKILSY